VLFPIWLALAVLTGHLLVLTRAKIAGIQPAMRIARCNIPSLLTRNPSMSISSFGGLAGGLTGALLFFRRARIAHSDTWV
jgi:hypothetical protein